MTHPPTRAVFLDRDGTLIEEVHYCRDADKVKLLPGVIEGLQRLKSAGFSNVIITNQSGIGRGLISPEQYETVHGRLLSLLGPGLIAGTYFCADVPGIESLRRKPAPGMLHEAARDHGLDLAGSWMIGDKSSDVASGLAAGTRAILVQTGYGAQETAGGAELVAKDFASAVEFILKHSDAR